MGEWTYSSFPFTGGQKGGSVDAKVLPPGSVTRIVNGVFDAQGAVAKRGKFSRVSGSVPSGSPFGGTLTQSARAVPFGVNGLAMVSDDDEPVLYSRDDDLDAWVPRARIASFPATKIPVYGGGGTAVPAASAINSLGHLGTVVKDYATGAWRFVVVDLATGHVVGPSPDDNAVPHITSGNCDKARVVACGAKFVLLFRDAVLNQIRAVTYDETVSGGAYVGWSAASANAGTCTGDFDAVGYTTTSFLLGRVETVAGVKQAYMEVVNATTFVAAVTSLLGRCDLVIGVNVTSDGLYGLAVWSDLGTTSTTSESKQLPGLGGSVTQTVSAVVARAVVSITHTSGTNAVVVAHSDVGGGYTNVVQVHVTAPFNFRAGAAPTAARPITNAGLASDVFSRDGQAYVVVRPGPMSTDALPSAVLVRLSDDVTKAYPVSVFDFHDGDLLGPMFTIPHPPKDGTGRTASQYIVANEAVVAGSRPIVAWKLSPRDTARYLTTKLPSGHAALAGGVPATFDGSFAKEIGFITEPMIVATSTAGGPIPAGTWGYVICVVYVDRLGAVHRSAPSIPVSVTTAAGKFIYLYCALPPVTLLGDSEKFTVEVYRTDNAGTTYYLLNDNAYTYVPGVNNAYFRFEDNTVATPTTARQVYTTGGAGDVLENFNVSSARCVASWRNRVVTAAHDDPGVVSFSKEYVRGEAPAMNEAVTVRCDDGGGIVALSTLDERLVVLAARGVFEVVGTPYNDVGVGDLAVQKVNVETGCVDARSVVSTPIGVMFQSQRGIVLLDRTGSIVEVGWDVRDRLALYPVVTSATLLAGSSRVAFTIADNGQSEPGETGETLVYDFKVGAWTTWLPNGQQTSFVSACLWGESWFALDTDSALGSLETSTPGLDHGSAPYWLGIETGWVSLLGLEGFWRCRRIGITGEWLGAHKLQMSVDYGYSTSLYPTTTRTFTSAELSASAEKVQIRLAPQKVDAVRLQVVEVAHTSPTDGPTLRLTGFGIEWMARRGMVRQPNAAKK